LQFSPWDLTHTEKKMRIRTLLSAIGLVGGIAATMHAQDTTQEKKPGGLNKVAHDISKTSKKAGRDVKAELKRASSTTHHALKTTGNGIKDEAKEATGYVPPDSGHKPGGLNKAAREVSKVGKKAGAQAKNGVKKTGAEAHGAATDVGKATKDTLKKVKPPTR
jgi:hypothetical protein